MIFSLKTPYWISLPTIWVLVCLAAISLQLFISRPCSGSPSPGCLSLLFSKGQGCRVPCLLWSKLSLATGTVPSLPSCYQSAITFPLFDFFFSLGDSRGQPQLCFFQPNSTWLFSSGRAERRVFPSWQTPRWVSRARLCQPPLTSSLSLEWDRPKCGGPPLHNKKYKTLSCSDCFQWNFYIKLETLLFSVSTDDRNIFLLLL